MSNKQISLASLVSIKSASGKIATENVKVDGIEALQKRTYGILTLTTDDDEFDIRLDEFDAIYKGFVNVWPAISGIKQQIIDANRSETKVTRDAIKAEKDAAIKAEKDAAAKQREEERAKAKADKDAAAKKAKEEKEAAAKKAADDKAKKDKEQAKKAADAKAKKDAAAK